MSFLFIIYIHMYTYYENKYYIYTVSGIVVSKSAASKRKTIQKTLMHILDSAN